MPTKKTTTKKTAKKATKTSAKTASPRVQKKQLMEKFGVHQKDTGSSKVQIAILTERINRLSEHLEDHPKDDHSRKGLLGLVGKRRQHLNYLRIHKKEEYEEVTQSLKLRK